jgi:CRP-like cAMP-binding protein
MPLEGNDLLASLGPGDRALLSARSTLMSLKTGDVLFEPGDLVDAVYVPLNASLASFVVALDNGPPVETALVGREGMIGCTASRGHLLAFARASVVQGGDFLRIASSDLDDARQCSTAIATLIARYADCMVAQILQSVACNAVHTLEQRAARWLAAAVDRTGDRNISMTQEQLGALLGTGRSYTSRQIQRFKSDDLVRTRRGGIAVIDYDGILSRACSCHLKVRRHFETVLYDAPAATKATA